MNIATIKTAHLSLKGDVLTIGALRELVRECDAARIPNGGTVAFVPVAGGISASVTWTANVTALPEPEAVPA